MNEHFITVETPKAGAKMLVDVPKISLEWNHVSRVVTIKNPATNQTEDKVILDNVSGSAAPGELLVLMGPSGAGKSSLLDVISGRQKDYTGSVLVNGEKWTKKMNKLASYVLQDDIFYETLTVKEHLLFQAELRMGKTFDAAQREARVNYVIEELGLDKCRDTQIGGGRIRGISGGQRKRLSFATEILTNPSLLFVDEPTSGLDSFMAESVILQLQKLAREGRTVIATIHQPSSELFVLFDRLYLLSDGQPIYNGKASDAVEYFASQGYQCPNYMNPTDYFMRQIIVLDNKSEAATRVQKFVDHFRAHARADDGSTDASLAGDDDDASYESSHLGTLGQLRVLCKRNVTRLVRDSLAFKARLGQSIIISVVVGLIFRQIEMNQAGVQSFTGALFFIVVNQFFGAATPEFASVPIELPLMAREYYGGLYRSYVWYLAKNVSELFFQIFFPLVFLVPAYFMIGFGASNATLFFTLYMYIALLSSSATGLGYMVSCLAKTPDIAPIIGILIILPFLIFGGLFINSNNVPVYFSWLEFISPMKYAFRGMSRAFWTTIDTIPCDSEPCAATTGAQVLANLALNKEDMAYDVGFLLWINAMFRAFGMIALARRLRGKK
ncbi:hypothetical protein SPRG_07739 [Saprolegnia parasitica CBS 223.65]|uniref:ABC transporter domain-containing protein n=1 Tax=Saprolegnia parasitica (strain CBS 223.65) TaxID=695850 RepID=A0A067CKD8_SAPPC|nr:hypothetical protein SPRG_07739 [Saprolegnia parasitica CBS 223.65]KDO27026.1 hypothetical protein SPRG_07739 [Saprolegnia parasitica CBS 223.65]|eukprot:XP_012202123.1 hypothetical protein SPRG_07739 [Saprolegnia parasitica CBS 223.65]